MVDPGKLTWVEHSTHDLVRRSVTYRLAPDHYPDRLQSSGTCTISDDGDAGTLRTVHGRLKVRALVVGGAVERAIVSGLREYLTAKTDAVDAFVAAGGYVPRTQGLTAEGGGRDNRCMGDRLDLVDLIDESGWPYPDQVPGAGREPIDQRSDPDDDLVALHALRRGAVVDLTDLERSAMLAGSAWTAGRRCR